MNKEQAMVADAIRGAFIQATFANDSPSAIMGWHGGIDAVMQALIGEYTNKDAKFNAIEFREACLRGIETP